MRHGVYCLDATTPQTGSRLTSLILSIVGFKIKGKDVQAGLVQWESQVLALEKDHKEILSPKIRRALLMNILPSAMQNRVLEHLDRLKTYVEVREKVVALCQQANGMNEADCNQLEAEWPEWPEEEWPAEEVDLQALADAKCYRCGGTGHMARDCATPSSKGKGKAGKGGKAGRQGSPG